jgi:hypothetical protein
MTTTAAAAILAVQPPTAAPGHESGLRPVRQLQALVADGWHLEQLAQAAGINDRTAWRTAHGYNTPSARTTAAVDELYEGLKWEDPGDGYAAVRSRRLAQRHGWTTAAVDEAANGLDAASDVPAEVDEVAVDRAVFGDPSCGPPTLRPSEKQAALRRLAGSLPNNLIAQRLGMATRTVVRHRMSQGLPAYTPAPPIDGPTC